MWTAPTGPPMLQRLLANPVRLPAFTALLLLSSTVAAQLQPPKPPAPAPTATATAQSGVQHRSYFFEAAKKDIDYSLFVPVGHDPAQTAGLVVLLHGLGSNPRQVLGYQGITTEAQKRGFVVVAPFGYNSRGWYGSRGNGKEGPLFGTKDDPDNLGELSQQDVMNVLELVQKEFRIDPDRIYLMGHSMGGAGTVHLAATYPQLWAAIAALAPALDDKTERLERMKHLPAMFVMGDRDRLVPVATVRRWVEAMGKLEMDHRYVEIEGGDHANSIARNPQMITGVFDFFAERRRQPAKPAEGASVKPATDKNEKTPENGK